MKVNDVLFKEAYVLLQAAKTITNELEEVVDLIVKEQITGLKPNTTYYYRAAWKGPWQIQGKTQTFRTLSGALQNNPFSFVVISCANYAYFQTGKFLFGINAYHGKDKHL